MAADLPLGEEDNQRETPAVRPEPASHWDWGEDSRQELIRELIGQRYRYVLQQIHVVNENIYRFLAIYQGIITALGGAQVLLFVNYRHWGLDIQVAKVGLVVLLVVETAIGCFVILLVVIGVLTWFDYRNEECDIADRVFGTGFRRRPSLRNWYRWYETYISLFVILFTCIAWALVLGLMLPKIR